MRRRHSNPISEDFSEVSTFLRERGIAPAIHDEQFAKHAKMIHGQTYVLILWRFRLLNLPIHGRAFVDELASDALQILPQIMMGYRKTSKLLMRGLIENTLRHIYFSDHPVEFTRMNRDVKWYVAVDGLFDYLRNHHDFMITERKFDAIAQLSNMYSRLSAGVHGRTVRDLEMRTALERIQYDHDAAKDDIAYLEKCAHAINFLLAIYHRDQVRSFSLVDQRLVFRAMPTEARRVWTDHEG